MQIQMTNNPPWHKSNSFVMWQLLVYCFLFGLSIAGRWTIGFVWLVENMPKAYRVNVALVYLVTDGATVFVLGLYIKLFGKDWTYPMYI